MTNKVYPTCYRFLSLAFVANRLFVNKLQGQFIRPFSRLLLFPKILVFVFFSSLLYQVVYAYYKCFYEKISKIVKLQ